MGVWPAQGTPLHVVSEVLGHASIAITKDVYGHLLEGDGRGGGGVDEPGSVRWLRCSRGSQRGPQNNKKTPRRTGKGPVSWARSEGLEPPTF